MPLVHACDFLLKPAGHAPGAACAVFGGDRYLRRLALRELLGGLLGEGAVPDVFEGERAEWRDVRDELCTPALFGDGQRVVLVEEADPFVSEHRGKLEEYVEQPSRGGLLVLETNAWLSTTRLYKLVDARGLAIECRPPEKNVRGKKYPDESRLHKWLVEWAAARHGCKLRPEAAEELASLVGVEFGLLDQNLAKLALFVEPNGTVTAELVRDAIGGWESKTVWEMLDAAADGDAATALVLLDRLFHANEEPVALFGSVSWSLRRFAAAIRLVEQAERRRQPIRLPEILQAAGFRNWPQEALASAERQLKQIGRQRAGRLLRWLLDADLALKLSHSSPQRGRFALEKLILRLAKREKPRAEGMASRRG